MNKVYLPVPVSKFQLKNLVDPPMHEFLDFSVPVYQFRRSSSATLWQARLDLSVQVLYFSRSFSASLWIKYSHDCSRYPCKLMNFVDLPLSKFMSFVRLPGQVLELNLVDPTVQVYEYSRSSDGISWFK